MNLEDVERARQAACFATAIDEHYDIISAFIKSIRGSDPDAGLYWLARMLEAGEDARFIARRLVILASEDVGMADSMGLVVADAAARAVEFVGLPEAGLNLAHAVVYLATAPKSNTAMAALSRAFDDVRRPPGRAGACSPAQRPPVPAQQAEGGRRLPVPAQRARGVRGPGVQTARRLPVTLGTGRPPDLLPSLACTGTRPKWPRRLRGVVGRRSLRRGGMVGVQEVPRPER